MYVELPELELAVAAGDAVGAVESVKSASDILTPVAGTVVGANAALNDTPALINRAPEADGWIAKVAVAGPEALAADGLMDEAAYNAFTSE